LAAILMSSRSNDTATPRDLFARLTRTWSQFGPPMRPSPFDTAVVQRVADGLAPSARVAILGLTPETIGCRWPEGTTLLALDHSAAMVAILWPAPSAPARSSAVLADWMNLPLADEGTDIACGDGCYVFLPYPHGFAALTAEVQRVLRPGGRFVSRVFARADQPEPLARIADEYARGGIGSVHALKLRLFGALHGKGGNGTSLDEVWRAWKKLPPIPADVAPRRGWTAQEVAGIEAYAGLTTRYYLPTLSEMRTIHADGFDEIECCVGDYEHAQHCPTFVLTRR
jgi:SAM-dependent methyltransferase